MNTIRLTARDLTKPLHLPTGEEHVIVVSSLRGVVLEMEDVHFHTDSAVLLPHPTGTQGTAPPGPSTTSLGVLGTCLGYAKDHPDRKLLIVGHTDTVGPPSYNVILSERRANNVLCALTGDRDGWAKICEQKHKPEDTQEILAWAASSLGWDCDPGGIDGVIGDRTTRAIRSFQQIYNGELNKHISIDGVVGPQTWQAFFDLYMLALRDVLKVDEAGLSSLRGGLTFVDSGRKAVGCGENHPVENSRADEYRSQTNRRVELLFFEPGQEPKLDCHPAAGQCKAGVCEIYDPDFYEFEHLPSSPGGLVDLVLEWPEWMTAALPSDLTLRIESGKTSKVPWSSGTVEGEQRRFVVHDLPVACPCTITACNGNDEMVLWHEQILDNPSHPPTWEHTLAEWLADQPDTVPEVTGGSPPMSNSYAGPDFD